MIKAAAAEDGKAVSTWRAEAAIEKARAAARRGAGRTAAPELGTDYGSEHGPSPRPPGSAPASSSPTPGCPGPDTRRALPSLFTARSVLSRTVPRRPGYRGQQSSLQQRPRPAGAGAPGGQAAGLIAVQGPQDGPAGVAPGARARAHGMTGPSGYRRSRAGGLHQRHRARRARDGPRSPGRAEAGPRRRPDRRTRTRPFAASIAQLAPVRHAGFGRHPAPPGAAFTRACRRPYSTASGRVTSRRWDL